jgi:serine protease
MLRSRCFALIAAALLTACGGGGGDDGGSPDPDPGPAPGPTKFTVSGRIAAGAGLVVDSDVNDPNAPYASNDTGTTAQALSVPVTLGGYVNEAGAGVDGRSKTNGDKYDIYKFSALAGQVASLIISDVDNGDPDLYLYDSTGTTILASSTGVDSYEQVRIPTTGSFILLIEAVEGASNYVLTVGNAPPTAASTGVLSTDLEFVPGEAIMKLKNSEGSVASKTTLAAVSTVHAFTMKAGAAERDMLVALPSASASGYADKAMFPMDVSERISQFATPELRQKWETLMAIKSMRRDPRMQYVEPNLIAHATFTPNDTYYPLQWHYPLINVPAAQDSTRGVATVVVAVVDTGVLLRHPDLQGQLISGFDFIKDPAISRDNDAIDANPDDPGDGSVGNRFHGTHVAGTIAAASNNALGVAGVAPLVKIMPVRVLGAGGGTSFDIIQGVRYAAGLSNDSGTVPAKRADVINLSLGRASGGANAAEQATYTEARAAGVIVVAAAGNDNISTPSYPASYNGVISVSATSIRKTRASYSNFGANIDVAAPGGDAGDVDGDGNPDSVLSTCGESKDGTINFGFCFLNGTSMATPHVAGVLALMKSINPQLTPDLVDQLLTSGRLTQELGPVGRDDDFGYGLIDARKAVVAAQGATPAPTPVLVATPRSLSFGAADNAMDLVLSNSGGGTLSVTAVTPSVSWITATRGTVDANGVGAYSIRVTRTGMADGTYSAQIAVTSNGGTVNVPVVVQVRATVVPSNAGFHYVLLIDSVSGETKYELRVAASNGFYSYRFTNVDSGTYELFAGTDSDNDDIICDDGEACGAYLTLEQPTLVTVDRDRSLSDFVSGFDVAIQSQSASAEKGSSAPRTLRRLKSQ